MRTRRVVLAVAAAITVLLGATVLTSVTGTRNVLRVVTSNDARTPGTHTVITCAQNADTQRRCDRIASLTLRQNERCLQIWGGPERALVILTTGEHVFVSRANSCEMYRWDELQKLTK
jgi:hypothetical protein